jgi:hypothetical protein
MEPQIPSRASEGRRHVCLAGIRQGLRPLRTPVHVCQCAGIRVHAIDWRDSRRGFPLPKGNRDADGCRLNALSEKITGAAFEVSNVFGAGFLEKVYENALSLELNLIEIKRIVNGI